MPRLFYPPLVEPGVYFKPKGIQESLGLAEMRDPDFCNYFQKNT